MTRMTKKEKKLAYLLLAVLVVISLGAAACPPASIPGPVPARPEIPIKQEPPDRHISSTVGETMIFSIATDEAVTVTWEMRQLRSGPRPPIVPAEPRPFRPEPVPPPPVRDEPLPFWEIGQDVDVTFSQVRIEAPEVGRFKVVATATAVMLVDGEEVRSVGWGVWYWEVEEAP